MSPPQLQPGTSAEGFEDVSSPSPEIDAIASNSSAAYDSPSGNDALRADEIEGSGAELPAGTGIAALLAEAPGNSLQHAGSFEQWRQPGSARHSESYHTGDDHAVSTRSACAEKEPQEPTSAAEETMQAEQAVAQQPAEAQRSTVDAPAVSFPAGTHAVQSELLDADHNQMIARPNPAPAAPTIRAQDHANVASVLPSQAAESRGAMSPTASPPQQPCTATSAAANLPTPSQQAPHGYISTPPTEPIMRPSAATPGTAAPTALLPEATEATQATVTSEGTPFAELAARNRAALAAVDSGGDDSERAGGGHVEAGTAGSMPPASSSPAIAQPTSSTMPEMSGDPLDTEQPAQRSTDGAIADDADEAAQASDEDVTPSQEAMLPQAHDSQSGGRSAAQRSLCDVSLRSSFAPSTGAQTHRTCLLAALCAAH